MTTVAPPTPTNGRQFRVDTAEGAERASRSRLLVLGGLSGVAAGLLFFGVQAAIPWEHDLPLELPRWEAVLGFWMILLVAPFAIGFAYTLSRLIAWERDGPLNRLGFVFAVVAFSILALTQSFQNAVSIVLTDEMKAEGSGPEAWERTYAGLNALDLGTDLAWDLFLGLWLLCIGLAMFRHSRLGARWAIPALALVPPFFAFNVAATPDPPVVDLGPVIGMYSTALSAWLVWLGTRRGEGESRHPEVAAQTRRRRMASTREKRTQVTKASPG
jgi:hypothetical protein